jgi:hypothetical protein
LAAAAVKNTTSSGARQRVSDGCSRSSHSGIDAVKKIFACASPHKMRICDLERLLSD